ncbi:helix-turn-helix domain-containing protein [Nonomuraea sp. NPDC000554]|uniref:helix-turn-helix domain-containing protein n=1 Tax=Nonomuraea sp. NPDC000554 TaxID=3154259 RepID=UPI003322E39D
MEPAPALVELVFSPAADETRRFRALKLLKLSPDRSVQVVAVGGTEAASALGGKAAVSPSSQSTYRPRPSADPRTSSHWTGWRNATLDAFAASESLRQTASRLFIHRSSATARLARAESELGFSVHSAEGRARLTLALALHRLSTPITEVDSAYRPPEHPDARDDRRGS